MYNTNNEDHMCSPIKLKSQVAVIKELKKERRTMYGYVQEQEILTIGYTVHTVKQWKLKYSNCQSFQT